MYNRDSYTKVKIQDICGPKPSGSEEEQKLFIGFLPNSSGRILESTARIHAVVMDMMDKEDRRILSRIFPKENVNIHYLCAILNKLNLSRYLRNTIPFGVPFQIYCDETVDLPSMEEQKEIAEDFRIIYEIKRKRRSQIKNSYLLMRALFIKEFGDSVPSSIEPDSDWKKLQEVVLEVSSRPPKDQENNDEILEFGMDPDTQDDENVCGVVHHPNQLPVLYKRFLSIKCNKSIIEPEFLAINLEMPYFKFLFNRNKIVSPMKELPILCPSLEKQRQFLEKIKPIAAFINKLTTNMDNWDKTFASYTSHRLP